MKQELIISEVAEIRKIARKINFFNLPREKIKMHLPLLTESENEQLEKIVQKHYGACGCGQGRIAGMFTLAGFVLLLCTGVVSIVQLGIWKTLLYYFLVSMLTMLIAKGYGIVQARKSLLRLADDLEQKKLFNALKSA